MAETGIVRYLPTPSDRMGLFQCGAIYIVHILMKIISSWAILLVLKKRLLNLMVRDILIVCF